MPLGAPLSERRFQAQGPFRQIAGPLRAYAPHPAVQPPSIERFAPVICDAASEQRKTASAAT